MEDLDKRVLLHHQADVQLMHQQQYKTQMLLMQLAQPVPRLQCKQGLQCQDIDCSLVWSTAIADKEACCGEVGVRLQFSLVDFWLFD